MRILENDIIIKSVVEFIFLIGILLANIYISVCKKHNFLTSGIHITSFFVEIFLICNFMQTVIIELPIETAYRYIGRVSLILGCLSGALTLSYLMFKKYTSKENVYVNPDLSSILTAIDDSVVIYDYNGKLIEFNNPKPIAILNNNVTTVEEQLKVLKPYIIDNNLKEIICDTDISNQFEFEILDTDNTYYLVTVSPIITNKWNNSIGNIFLFHDITQEKMLIKQIDQQNHLLETANIKLQDYVKVASTLEDEKERLKLIGEIQNELIVRIEKIINNIRNIQEVKFDSDENYQHKVLELNDELRSILQTIRKSVNNIAAKKGGI